MNDLISRQDAVDEIHRVYEYEFPTASGAFDEFVTIIIPNILRNLPSAGSERKTGYWIDTDNYYQRWKCSECGCHTRDAKPNYCPHCGAKNER